MSFKHSPYAALARGLAMGFWLLLPLLPAGPAHASEKDPVEAWVTITREAGQLVVRGHAAAAVPTRATGVLTIAAHHTAGTTRTRQSIDMRLDPSPRVIARLKLSVPEAARIEAALVVQPLNGQPIHVRQQHPPHHIWVHQPVPRSTEGYRHV
ncbi:hypothetical protein [Spiribacter pallidus]|jgi:hypothetical protein|uniref:hypothetical protein n=1 Tax=Spiribacter pallidus TaxID=1987936 RepID=UPI0034A01445